MTEPVIPNPAAATAEQPSDPTFDAFAEVCTTLTGFDGEADPAFVDGYFIALSASRRFIETDEWLPLLGGEAFERAFADPADAARARGAWEAWLLRRRMELEPERLLDRPDDVFVTPLYDEWTDEDREEIRQQGKDGAEAADTLQTGCLWASGFMACVEDFADDWPSPADSDDSPEAEGYRAVTQLISCLTLSPQDESYRAFVASQWQKDPPTRDELLDEVCYAVQDLRVYWLSHGPKPAQRRVEAAPGRNDPCPCGSGKKYKKCHGAPAAA